MFYQSSADVKMQQALGLTIVAPAVSISDSKYVGKVV